MQAVVCYFIHNVFYLFYYNIQHSLYILLYLQPFIKTIEKIIELYIVVFYFFEVNSMGQIKAVIYDCDGVIVNSDNAIISYYSWLAEKSGVEIPDWSDENFKRIVLSYTEDGIVDVISKGNPEIKERIYNVIKNSTYSAGFEDIILEDTLPAALELLKERGLFIAVDTNRGRSLSDLLTYFNIREYFSCLITSRDVESPKPSPEGVYKICDYYKIEPKEVLFLGDSMTDYHAAKQSGAFFLSYKNHLHNAPIINDHKDIIKYLY